MNITATIKSSQIKYVGAGKIAFRNNWKLSDSLREKITEYAREDAVRNVYMGDKFLDLRKKEVAKVAPNRAVLMGKMNQSICSGNMADMKEIREADERLICILLGEPYKAEFQSEGTGSAVHVYDGNGDEVLTYTAGTGWHEKESKAETDIHRALKAAYYDAFCAARQEIKKAALAGTNARGGFGARV